MLHEFLQAHRDAILALTKSKTAAMARSRPAGREFERELPAFYAYLIGVLRSRAGGAPPAPARRPVLALIRHARESSRLGHTVSQVVHGYGAICQAIMETAQSMNAEITPGEFCTLNLCLDTAIAEAVSEFQKARAVQEVQDQAKQLGFLVHELRNALAGAILAHALIQQGLVGTGGSTNAMLERALRRMRDMLDRSFAEMRMRCEPETHRRPLRIVEAVEEVEASIGEDARRKGLTVSVDIDPGLRVNADPQYLVSALSNLVQNAVKFTPPGGAVWVRSRRLRHAVVLEVEDRCGGLPPGKSDELFAPFIQKSADRTGLGLGLAICRQAVELNHGTISVRDLPGQGCVFAISLPMLGDGEPEGGEKPLHGPAGAARAA